ncbi:MAG: tetratricopeptide repeat protein [bacterium]|nr:tetratricopeptide repeat protein [bacterium]
MAKKGLISLFLFFLFCSPGWAGFASKINKGNKLYKKQDYDQALQKYIEAEVNNPGSPFTRYNIGNTYYQQSDYEKAVAELNKALSSKDNKFREKAYYNLGNAYYRMNDYAGAIEHYKKALEIDPADEDAKYNIEIIRKRMQENKTNQQQQQDQKKNKQDKNKQDKKEQEKKNKENKEKRKEKEKEQNRKQQQQQQNKMSKEDAKRLLDALRDEENKTQQKIRPVQGGGAGTDKDW